MYLLYIDESGDGGSAPGSTRHLVLSGIAMHEGQWKKLTRDLDHIQAAHFPLGGGPLEFHASEIRAGRGAFRNLQPADRLKLMGQIYKVVATTTKGLTLFAAVVDKPSLLAKAGKVVDPYETAFEALCTMFNFFLKRIQRQTKSVLRGIVVFDESRPALSKQLRTLLAKYQASGTRWDTMTNLIETAFFFDSRTSRIMQLADFSAYAVFRFYEFGDDSFLKLIHHKFDKQGSKIHGFKCYPIGSTKICSLP